MLLAYLIQFRFVRQLQIWDLFQFSTEIFYELKTKLNLNS